MAAKSSEEYCEKIFAFQKKIKEWVLKSLRPILISLTIVFCLLVLLFYITPYNSEYKLIKYDRYIINTKKLDPLTNISSKAKLLHELEKDNIILTPQEYTNNIISYYNLLLSFMAGLIVILSVITYFQLKFVTRKELPQVLYDSIKDSRDFENKLKEAITGFFDEKYVSYSYHEENVKDEIENYLEVYLGKKKVENSNQ